MEARLKKYKASHVFVPGGLPSHTYIERAESAIKDRLESANDNLCKLVTLTGQTKSGKTVITQKVFSELEDQNIWINGGSIEDESDIWSQVVDQLGGWTVEENSEHISSNHKIHGKGTTEANALVVKGKAELGGELGGARGTGQKKSREVSPKTAALKLVREHQACLIVDDFHYFDRNLQGSFVRAVKPLVFHGVPVILIAIPHRRFDAIKVEREITGRVENIDVPYWHVNELEQIPRVGFPLLNVDVSQSIVNSMASESLGSPHLMQEFCRELCRSLDVKETLDQKIKINEMPKSIFSKVGENTGKTIFDKLATGPRQRSDRIPRKLVNGDEVDIYKVVLFALARLSPGMQTIKYEDLRAAIRDILEESIPQAHEISRVLDKMSEIAASDEASTPVIDWEKEDQKLHITDPFFAFYLKWGSEKI